MVRGRTSSSADGHLRDMLRRCVLAIHFRGSNRVQRWHHHRSPSQDSQCGGLFVRRLCNRRSLDCSSCRTDCLRCNLACMAIRRLFHRTRRVPRHRGRQVQLTLAKHISAGYAVDDRTRSHVDRFGWGLQVAPCATVKAVNARIVWAITDADRLVHAKLAPGAEDTTFHAECR